VARSFASRAGALAVTLWLGVPHAFAAPAPAAASLDTTRLAAAIAKVAAVARPGVLGVGVEVLDTGERWFRNGDRRLPMQSVFKAPLAAAVLDAADHGRLRLDSTIVLTRGDLSVQYSPVASAFPSRTAWTVDELMERAVETSDNTAADVLLRAIGGPAALTAWLRARGVDGVRIDRYEREQQPEILALGPFRPAWANGDSMDRAKLAVPDAARRAARDASLRGGRDSMTPRGAVAFLTALWSGRLVLATSTARLQQMMTAVVTGPNRLHAGLPPAAALAHKTGTGPTVLGVATATNDIGVATLADGRRVAIVALLSGSTAGEEARDRMLANVSRAVIDALR